MLKIHLASVKGLPFSFIMSQSIVIVGPAYPLRGGGMATFNERLARQFQREGNKVVIYTFSLQYPSFLFPGTSQFSTEAAPEDLDIKVKINSINPFNWIKVGKELKHLSPDFIVVRYWLPFMAPCFGTILRIVKKNKQTKVICISDNVIPHEHRFGDKFFTKYFIKPVDAFITMSEKVMSDLKTFTQKPSIQTVHPLYDSFGKAVSKEEARAHLKLPVDDNIILFFGFIRKYKGLDMLLDAMSLLKDRNVPVKLLIAGEFYNDKKVYEQQIERLNLQDILVLHNNFIADNEVKYYFSAADFVVQPYRNATQSGVTPLAYHFNKPLLVTNVGGLPAMVPDRKVGLVAEPNAADIAQKIEELYKLGENYFLPYLQTEKQKYSWQHFTQVIYGLIKSINKTSN